MNNQENLVLNVNLSVEDFSEKILCEQMIKMGYTLEYGRLSVCDIRKYAPDQKYSKTPYQVHCDDFRKPFSELYDDLEKAVLEFLKIKHRIKSWR